jgi:hypothetical protein
MVVYAILCSTGSVFENVVFLRQCWWVVSKGINGYSNSILSDIPVFMQKKTLYVSENLNYLHWHHEPPQTTVAAVSNSFASPVSDV